MNQSNQPITVLFLDFDGVVVESVGIKTEVFRELFEECPRQMDDIVAYHLRNSRKIHAP